MNTSIITRQTTRIVTSCLRPITGESLFVLPPLDGTRTIRYKGYPAFSYIDEEFGYAEHKPEMRPTPETKVAVFDLRLKKQEKRATLDQMFDSLPPRLEAMTLTEDQVIAIGERRPEKFAPDGRTFFLTRANGKFRIVHVPMVRPSVLSARLRTLDDPYPWEMRQPIRVMIPLL